MSGFEAINVLLVWSGRALEVSVLLLAGVVIGAVLGWWIFK